MTSFIDLRQFGDVAAKVKLGTVGVGTQNRKGVPNTQHVNSILERPFQGLRTPMAVTTRSWMSEGKYITLWVNPSELSWTMPKRETVSKTAAGAIRNSWLNRFRNTYYDEPTLSITFQTGNILPYANLKPGIFGSRYFIQNNVEASNQGPQDTRWNSVYTPESSPELGALLQSPPVPPGLQNFFDFIALIDQPILRRGRELENRHILFYRTQVFPSMRIEGYFSPEGLAFSESVDNANRLNWTAQFQVYTTYPKLWDADALKRAYSNALREGGFASGLLSAGIDLTAAQQQQSVNATSVLPKNPKDPDAKALKPQAKTPKKALVNKKGQTAEDLKNLINTTNKETESNFSKTIDSYVKKYQLAEPEKSKFIAEMKKLERQHIGNGSYAPRSLTNQYATTVLAAVGGGAL